MCSIEIEDTIDRVEIDDGDGCCNAKKGPHILILSLLCIPGALVLCFCVTFYYGAWTWYNIYLYFSEEKTIWHKISICPILILLFPFIIILIPFVVGVYASIVQISWCCSSWLEEFCDFEKKSCEWICCNLGLPDCCPYDVQFQNDESELEPMKKGNVV